MAKRRKYLDEEFEASASLPLWREALLGIDWLSLRISAVYLGIGIPLRDDDGLTLPRCPRPSVCPPDGIPRARTHPAAAERSVRHAQLLQRRVRMRVRHVRARELPGVHAEAGNLHDNRRRRGLALLHQ